MRLIRSQKLLILRNHCQLKRIQLLMDKPADLR
ncbi:hypothetical protein V6Z12_D08G227100 [Gossypium hirsutum]